MAGGGMSHLARAPRSGIDNQTQAAGGRSKTVRSSQAGNAAERMNVLQISASALALLPTDTVGVGSSGRPARGRNRTKTELDEKIRKPADNAPKKTPPRKAPARGRYVDEYARPAS
jgi:hypothetical protein